MLKMAAARLVRTCTSLKPQITTAVGQASRTTAQVVSRSESSYLNFFAKQKCLGENFLRSVKETTFTRPVIDHVYRGHISGTAGSRILARQPTPVVPNVVGLAFLVVAAAMGTTPARCDSEQEKPAGPIVHRVTAMIAANIEREKKKMFIDDLPAARSTVTTKALPQPSSPSTHTSILPPTAAPSAIFEESCEEEAAQVVPTASVCRPSVVCREGDTLRSAQQSLSDTKLLDLQLLANRLCGRFHIDHEQPVPSRTNAGGNVDAAERLRLSSIPTTESAIMTSDGSQNQDVELGCAVSLTGSFFTQSSSVRNSYIQDGDGTVPLDDIADSLAPCLSQRYPRQTPNYAWAVRPSVDVGYPNPAEPFFASGVPSRYISFDEWASTTAMRRDPAYSDGFGSRVGFFLDSVERLA
eukprot:GILK01002264.1.p1 GENE.GILK01002264.1~~GILK01002264.1.p1  ORF type:complete len:411 (-),score=50.07 GILK01002264.1:128-1360(-)